MDIDQPLRLLDLPPEVISYIVRLIYLESIPRSSHRNLDLHGLPSTYSDGRRISTPHSDVQATLWSLCLTCRDFFHHARPLLYRRIHVTLPYSFVLLIRTLGAAALATAYEQFQETGKLNQDVRDPNSFPSIVAAAGFARVLGTNLLITQPAASDGTPPQIRRTASSDGTAAANPGATDDEHLDLVWRPDPHTSGNATLTRYSVSLHSLNEAESLQSCIRVVDFSCFRTQGMRRTIGEGMDARFVTSPRLLALLTAAPNLAAFGASQTMDSSLSIEVLEALMFRGGNKVHKPARLRGVSVERRRKGEQTSLAALDFTDCVSGVFEKAMEEFVKRHLNRRVTHTLHEATESETDEQTSTDAETEGMTTDAEDDDQEEESRRGRRGRQMAARRLPPLTAAPSEANTRGLMVPQRSRSRSAAPVAPPTRSTRFPNFQRLSLHGILWRTDLLSPFLLAFTGLTHLDLSKTRIDAASLALLSSSPTLQLESLSLAGCRSLTSHAITEFLVDSPVTAVLTELSLEGSLLFPTPLHRHDLEVILDQAPTFRSGGFRYLDLGGCGLDDELLQHLRPQPRLLDLGLSASPGLSLSGVARFLQDRAPNVQVLELSDSCYNPAVTSGVLAFDLSTQLIGPCCTTPPVPLSLQLAQMGFKPPSGPNEDGLPPSPPPEMPREPTNLRVIGLNGPSLRSVRAGFGSWKVIWGSGQRGWVVDTSAGPNPGARDEEAQAASKSSGSTIYQPPSLPPLRRANSGSGSRGRLNADEERRARSRSRHRQISLSRRTGYEPETPPLSRHASLSPSRSLKRAIGRNLHDRSRSSGAPTAASVQAALAARTTPLSAATRLSDMTSTSLSRSRSLLGREGAPSFADHEEGGVFRYGEDEGEDEGKTETNVPLRPRNEIIRNLPPTHPRRQALEAIVAKNGHVSSEVGWHSKKMEVLLGFGLLGRERGSYAFAAYCT
ncbi:unnamed protein product [Parajaminaea phylloscopi]